MQRLGLFDGSNQLFTPDACSAHRHAHRHGDRHINAHRHANKNRHGDRHGDFDAAPDQNTNRNAPDPDAHADAVCALLPLVALMDNGMALPHCAKGTARVSADSRLRVRADPNPEAAVLGYLAPGELVTVWAVESEWAIVQAVNGLAGWASSAYLKAEDVYQA